MTRSTPASTPISGHILDRRLLLFTGKGGVGKSTVVAALAVEAARRGQRPLIVELGHRASMQSIFAVPDIGHEPIAVTADGKVWAANLDFDEAVVDYVVEQVKIRRVARTITGNRTLQGLFRAAPAVREIVMLNKLRLFEREQSRGQPSWGPILVDLDATGHALMLLDMPQILARLLSGGPLRGLVDVLVGLFTDPTRTLLNLVTLPAEIPVQETLELHERLGRAGGIQLGALFVNQVPGPPISPDLCPLLPELAAVAARAGLATLAGDLDLASRAVADEARARDLITTLRREVHMPLARLPRIDLQDPAALPTLGRLALTELAAYATPDAPTPAPSSGAWAVQEGA